MKIAILAFFTVRNANDGTYVVQKHYELKLNAQNGIIPKRQKWVAI